MRQLQPSHLQRETDTVRKMIALYCRAHHVPQDGDLCPDCQALADYAAQRVVRCPFGAGKPTCANCPVHCYAPEQREDIRRVMRYASPRMLLHHPILAVLHLLDGLRKPRHL
jgi:hypothetical protein